MTMNRAGDGDSRTRGADVDEAATAAHADLFRALSDPTRLAILQHLGTGEHRVRDLVDHLGLAQSTVSTHLACLRGCGLVTSRADGRSSWFALAVPDALVGLLDAAGTLLGATGSQARLCVHLAHPSDGEPADRPAPVVGVA